MKHRIVLEKRAQKFILKQSQIHRERILKSINALPAGDTKLMQGNSALYRVSGRLPASAKVPDTDTFRTPFSLSVECKNHV